MNNYITSEEGIELIKSFEGFKSKPYLCSAGVPTIGIGTTVYPNGKKVTLRDGAIDLETAMEYVHHDLQKFEATVNKSVSVDLTQNQFDALVCFTYNVGPGSFTSSTLLKLLNTGNYDSVPTQLLRWNKAKGVEVAGLTRRRKAEGDLFSS